MLVDTFDSGWDIKSRPSSSYWQIEKLKSDCTGRIYRHPSLYTVQQLIPLEPYNQIDTFVSDHRSTLRFKILCL